MNKTSLSAKLPRKDVSVSMSFLHVISQTLSSPWCSAKTINRRHQSTSYSTFLQLFNPKLRVTSSTWHLHYGLQIIGSGTPFGTFETWKLINKVVIKRLRLFWEPQSGPWSDPSFSWSWQLIAPCQVLKLVTNLCLVFLSASVLFVGTGMYS